MREWDLEIRLMVHSVERGRMVGGKGKYQVSYFGIVVRRSYRHA